MGHFSVLVVGDNVEAQLAPYHEFECTGRDDEFVQNVDITEKVRKEYEGGSSRRLRDSKGKYHEPWAPEFYREPTEEERPHIGMGCGVSNGILYDSRDWGDGLGYRTKVQFIPEGFTELEVPYPELMTFAEYVREDYGYRALRENTEPRIKCKDKSKSKEDAPDKYGFMRVDNDGNVLRVIDRTNPNAHWDWFVVGGRWSEFLIDKHGAFVSSGLKRDIDFEGMKRKAAQAHADEWTAYEPIFRGKDLPDWAEIRESCGDDIAAAREKYRNDPIVKSIEALSHSRKDGVSWCNSYREYFHNGDRDAFIEKAKRQAVSCFAFVRDAKWAARGDMGMFAVVHDEKEDWLETFEKLLADVPDDARITIVDCHI